MKYFGFIVSEHFLLPLNFNFKATDLIVQALDALVFFHAFILQQRNLKRDSSIKQAKLVLMLMTKINNN